MQRTKYQQSRPHPFNLLKPVYQFPGVVKLIVKRQWHYLGLSLLALLNIILAVGLVTNASFFSQAVDRVVLLQELGEFSEVTGRPPFSTSIYIFPSRRSPVPLDKAEELAQHIANILSTEVGLPVRHLGLQVSSGSLSLRPAPDSSLYQTNQTMIASVEALYIAGISPQMEIIEGVPMDEQGASADAVDVWMHEEMAQSMGIHIGEKLLLGVNVTNIAVPLQVTGIWRAKDAEDDFWFNDPDVTLKNKFLVRRSDYAHAIQPMVPAGSAEASWYVILDETEMSPSQSEAYFNGFNRSLELITKFLPGARMNTPPLDPLKSFVDRSSTMTVLLLGYNLPAFGILLYFLALTSGIIAQWQRRETVMLVSRGMSAGGVLMLTLLEQALLFAAGYPLGIAFGMVIAWVMGFTESFLSFTTRAPLPVSLEGFSIPLTLLALAFSLFARLWPAARAARSSLTTEERERARPMRKPFWYRSYLDLVLLLPTLYAYDQMAKRGSLAGLITDKPEDLYRDPLLIVVPALFILTASLITMRGFALFMRGLDLVAGRAPWLTLHLALRQLGRQSLDYVQPLLLVIIALAMGVYTLSMAASLDQWTLDRMYYRSGADFTFTPRPATEDTVIFDGGWIPLPQEFAALPGIQAATRVSDFSARIIPTGGKELKGRFLGIDRAEFPSVAWFRPDFASESLGAMMNRLAYAPEGVLVSQRFLDEHNLKVGDPLPLIVNIENLTSAPGDYVIVGAYHYFPTVYEDTPTVIGNLEHLSMQVGLTTAHDIWLKVQPGVDGETLVEDIQSNLHLKVVRIRDSRAWIAEEQGRMERVGIFGTLSVGFLSTAVMAILGLLIYSYASLQERAYRLAVLNAVGLLRGQIMAQVVMEYAFLALFGAAAGAAIGLFASELFVPFFRFTGEQGVPLPPLVPVIAGGQLRNLSLIFGITIITAEVGSIVSLLHQQLTQILKRVWI